MSIRNTLRLASVMAASLFSIGQAQAKPPAQTAFCVTYPDAPACTPGFVDCSTCHTVAPARNVYGAQLEVMMLPGDARPLSDQDFLTALPEALRAIENDDADGDGYSNLEEFVAGSNASVASDTPAGENACNAIDYRPSGLDVCAFDPVYVFKKIKIDFCGEAPSYAQMKEFGANPTTDLLHTTLDECLKSEYWIAKDGVLWNMASSKIRPIQAIKAGDGAGPIPLADYDDDYNYFVYATSGQHDARELLTGDYFVERNDGETTTYTQWQRNPIQDVNERGYNSAQGVVKPRRAGMLTHRWFLMSNTMFTGIPRTTAAQAYRAYLGFDISKLEGLDDVSGEPKDYDNKGVTRAECAVCHATLDPLTYPFSRYEGIGGGDGDLGENYIPFSYNPSRMARFTGVDGAYVAETPEAGILLGQPVANLKEWAQVASASDPFAQSLVGDFWKLLLGEDPRPAELQQFEYVWRRFMDEHEYRVEPMLHDLVMTEAYGVP